MQRFLLGVLIALTLLPLGCHQHVVRDAAVYQAELTQYDNWAVKQADLLAGFMAQSCTCEETIKADKAAAAEGLDPPDGDSENKKFTTPECAAAADYVLTVRARHTWHLQMSLFNGSLLEDPPASPPPEIPASSTLCPGGVQ